MGSFTKLISSFRVFVFGSLAAISFGQVISYEGFSFPEEQSWERFVDCDPDRFLADGWLVQEVEVACGGPPGGDRDRYLCTLSDFAGATSFFFEWRVQTTGDRSEIPGVAPCSFTTADLYGVSYHFTMARDQVRLIRDNFLPIVFVDLQADVAHTYRLELRGANSYEWYIDGQTVDFGSPEGPYPTPTAQFSFRSRAWYQDSIASWDFVRLGIPPTDAGGDYDSDSATTLIDHYFVVDCLTKDGPGIFGGPGEDSGPGCRFADFDADSDVDLLDFAEFQNSFGG